MGRARTMGAIVMVAWLATGTARAHGIGGAQFEAPLPLWLLYSGAGATVALTALWLSLRPESDFADTGGTPRVRIRPRGGRWLRVLAGLGFVVLTGVALWQGITGRQVAAENFATLFVWAIWVKGVAILAISFGNPWRVLSPWERVYDGLVWLEGDEIRVSGGYPRWLGLWPALGGFVILVGIVENMTVVPRSPALTATVIAGYALVMVVGGVWFGREWFEHADTFGVLYRLLGRVAPLQMDRTPAGGYRIVTRAPWSGCVPAMADWSGVVFVIGIVYTVSFDGATSTPEYQSLILWLGNLVGVSGSIETGVYFVGFVTFIGSYLAVSFGIEWLGMGGRGDWWEAGRWFVGTVLPIGAAYEVAHNYAFVLTQLEAAFVMAGVTGVDGLVVAWLSLPVFWLSQVVLIVGGHLAAVVAAHQVAVRRYGPDIAGRGHLPLVGLMVGYTMVSLWFISRPIVT